MGLSLLEKNKNQSKLLKESLTCFRDGSLDNHMKDKLGAPRFEQYKANQYNMFLIYKFFKGELSGDQYTGVFSGLIGMEFNLYLIETLKEYGAKNIQQEVDIDTTKIDVVASSDGTVRLREILPNLREDFVFLEPGNHSFEAKAYNILKNDPLLKQITKAQKHYTYCHAFVLAHTIVSQQINSEVRSIGGTILRADLTKEQLTQRVLNLQNRF